MRAGARAERPPGLVAEPDRVQRPPEREREQQAERDERRDLPAQRGRVPGERADLPEAVLVERLAVDQREALHVGDQREADRRAGEREPHRRRAAAPRGPDAVDDHRGHARADEGEPDVDERADDAEQRRRRHDRGRGARVDAEQAGVGERVARQRLHQRPAHPERRADDQPEDRARDPQVVDDDRVVGAVRAARPAPRRGRRGIGRAPTLMLSSRTSASPATISASPPARLLTRARHAGAGRPLAAGRASTAPTSTTSRSRDPGRRSSRARSSRTARRRL